MGMIIGCSNAIDIADDVANELGTVRTVCETLIFADGETKFVLNRDPKGDTVVIVQAGLPDANKSLMEVCQAADVAKKYKATKVIAVFTYLPYGRQDKRAYKNDKSGFQPKTLKLEYKMLDASGVDLLVILDAHPLDTFNKIESLKHLKMKILNIPCGKAVVDRILKRNKLTYQDIVLVAPDAGARPRIKQIADQIKEEVGITIPVTELEKKRDTIAQTTKITGLSGT
ncbi:MAG: ribose-phosphate pyrophosphokinase-like domain-containing protein, partial [archaeon]